VAHFNNLIPFLQKINDIHGTELRLYSNKMKLAGTSDCIAKYDGELSIIDYKTKRSNQQEEWMTDHFIQGTAYSEMFNIISLFFTEDFQSEYEPIHLLLGVGIVIIAVFILIKKIIGRRNKK
jgi:hypothetical protein